MKLFFGIIELKKSFTLKFVLFKLLMFTSKLKKESIGGAMLLLSTSTKQYVGLSYSFSQKHEFRCIFPFLYYNIYFIFAYKWSWVKEFSLSVSFLAIIICFISRSLLKIILSCRGGCVRKKNDPFGCHILSIPLGSSDHKINGIQIKWALLCV